MEQEDSARDFASNQGLEVKDSSKRAASIVRCCLNTFCHDNQSRRAGHPETGAFLYLHFAKRENPQKHVISLGSYSANEKMRL